MAPELSDATAGGLAALGSAGFWAVGVVLFGRRLAAGGAEPLGAAAANLFKNVLAALTFGALLLVQGSALPPMSSTLTLLGSGVLGFAVGDTLYFAGVARCGAHTAAMVGNLAVPVAALLAFLFLDETLSAGVLGAMAVVVLGIVLVLSEPGRQDTGPVLGGRGQRVHGALLAAAAAASQGLSIASGHAGFAGVGVLVGTEIRLIGGIAGAALAAALQDLARPRGELRRLWAPLARVRTARALLVPAVFAALLPLPLHGFALREAQGGIAAVLLCTTPLYTLPIGWALGERPGWRRLLGTALGFVGVAGVILLGENEALP